MSDVRDGLKFPVDPDCEHDYCEPGCSLQAHCWKCVTDLPQTPEWDEWWIDEDGVSIRKSTQPLAQSKNAGESAGEQESLRTSEQ